MFRYFFGQPVPFQHDQKRRRSSLTARFFKKARGCALAGGGGNSFLLWCCVFASFRCLRRNSRTIQRKNRTVRTSHPVLSPSDYPTTPLVLTVCVALVFGTIQAPRDDVSLSWCVTTRFAMPFIFLSPNSADSDLFALFNAQPTVTLRCLRWPEHQDPRHSEQPDPQGDISQTRSCSTFCKRCPRLTFFCSCVRSRPSRGRRPSGSPFSRFREP